MSCIPTCHLLSEDSVMNVPDIASFFFNIGVCITLVFILENVSPLSK